MIDGIPVTGPSIFTRRTFLPAVPGNMAEIRDLAGNDPELQDELLAQQRMIHEQQRCLADGS